MRWALTIVYLLATAGFLLATASLANAVEIPRYPVDDICSRFADYAVGGSASVQKRHDIAESCVLAQQDAYDQLKRDWRIISPEEQVTCLKLTLAGHNYRSLEACAGSLSERRSEALRAKDSGPFKY